MTHSEFIIAVAKIQRELVAPKDQRNTFSKFDFRNCEGILAAVKPHLGDFVITLNDEMVAVGDRVYCKATATISNGEHSISTSSYAREAMHHKGMSEGQLSGATSSYARKYALCGLLAIDGNDDLDAVNQSTNNQEGVAAPDQGWVDAIRSGTSSLEDIDDINYRSTIGNLL